MYSLRLGRLNSELFHRSVDDPATFGRYGAAGNASGELLEDNTSWVILIFFLRFFIFYLTRMVPSGFNLQYPTHHLPLLPLPLLRNILEDPENSIVQETQITTLHPR